MQLCNSHWNQLTDAIKARGLGHLIIEKEYDMQEALNRAITAKEIVLKDYCPRLMAHNMIMNNAIRCTRGAIRHDNCCPVCSIGKNGVPEWIDQAADSVNGFFAEFSKEKLRPEDLGYLEQASKHRELAVAVRKMLGVNEQGLFIN
jgi:hypothetical protein